MATNTPLTTLRIKNLKVAETAADAAEHRGLRVTRTRGGYRYWYRFRCRASGRLTEITILKGSHRLLAEARVVHQDLKEQRARGQIPQLPEEYRKAPPVPDSREGAPTIKRVVVDYLKGAVYPRRKLKGAREADRILSRLVVDHIGDLPADQLTRREVADLVKRETDKGHATQAGYMLREFTAAIEFAIGTGALPDDFANPAQAARASLARTKTRLTSRARSRYLTDRELSQFLAWLPASGFSRNHRAALSLTLETGCRSGEAIAALWDDFDLDVGLWHIPENKTDTPRDLRLPRQTVDWLSTARRADPDSEFLCPLPDRTGHIRQASLSHAAWRMRKKGTMLDTPPWSPHDLRRTCRTGLARLGCPQPVAEAILGHTKGGIVGVYDLHRYVQEGGEWLQRWGDHLEKRRGILSGNAS